MVIVIKSTLFAVGFDKVFFATEPIEDIISAQVSRYIGQNCLVGRPFVCGEIFNDFMFEWVCVDVDH